MEFEPCRFKLTFYEGKKKEARNQASFFNLKTETYLTVMLLVIPLTVIVMLLSHVPSP
jgi:hypothetical protein